MKPPSAIRQARCEPGHLKTLDGQQRQQAQERRHPLRPLAAVKTPGWEQPQAQRLWRRQLHPCLAVAAAPLAATTCGTAAAAAFHSPSSSERSLPPATLLGVATDTNSKGAADSSGDSKVLAEPQATAVSTSKAASLTARACARG